MLLSISVVACGGESSFSGSNSTPPPSGPIPGSPEPSATLVLYVSNPQMPSDGSSTVTLTALARDSNNIVVANADIRFSASSGSLKLINSITDADGAATATLSTGGDRRNRTITVTATDTKSGLTATNTVEVAGTGFSISGDNTLSVGEQTRLTIFLTDFGGRGIANQDVSLAYDTGLTVSPSVTTLTTNSAGIATIDVTPTRSGTKNVTVSALDASSTFSIDVSAPGSLAFAFTAATNMVPVETNEPAIGITRDLEVCLSGVAPLAGYVVDFSANRGVFASTGNVVANATTNASGCATAAVSSSSAGLAQIDATVKTGPNTSAVGSKASMSIEFVATTADTLELQAEPSTVGIGEKTTLTATVRDANKNLVKNKVVVFSVIDGAGTVSPVSGVTNSIGQVSTVYTAGAITSALNGVKLRAVVQDTIGTTDVSGDSSLTVAGKALHVVLGTGNSMSNHNETTYKLPYVAIVTDSAGNRVANKAVSLSIWSYRYYKGRHIATYGPTGGFVRWSPSYAYTCANEDLNRNGHFEVTNDLNANRRLDPGNIATLSVAQVVTDNQGLINFDVLYPENYAYWLDVELEARVGVVGSEDVFRTRFNLIGLDSDFNSETKSPPGARSPFGVGTGNCSVDES